MDPDGKIDAALDELRKDREVFWERARAEGAREGKRVEDELGWNASDPEAAGRAAAVEAVGAALVREGRRLRRPGTPAELDEDFVFGLDWLAELYRRVGPDVFRWSRLASTLHDLATKSEPLESDPEVLRPTVLAIATKSEPIGKNVVPAEDHTPTLADMESDPEVLRPTVLRTYIEEGPNVDDIREARHARRTLELFFAAVLDRSKPGKQTLDWSALRAALPEYDRLPRDEKQAFRRRLAKRLGMKEPTIERNLSRVRHLLRNPVVLS